MPFFSNCKMDKGKPIFLEDVTDWYVLNSYLYPIKRSNGRRISKKYREEVIAKWEQRSLLRWAGVSLVKENQRRI